ncbi:hypothetical protein GCM10019016_026800 [Streptomyces prasinosporus]|uniref:MacB-like periplasmic core domain-containing protein n=1 Tax=Streptomyces prasinosporus TaxID=68256 RepID=A0ABP6TK51_9ACTN
MFFTYLRRELRRRRKTALVVASGLALGIALVVVVNSVSAGMGRAQEKVLQSLYGPGADMTVTKAAGSTAAPERPRFRFDARDDGSGEEQSSDRVMVQGFQTPASSTVAEVGEQDGVADAVGGLSLQVVKVSGEFTRGRVQQEGQGAEGGPGDGQPSPQGPGPGRRRRLRRQQLLRLRHRRHRARPRSADLLRDHRRTHLRADRDRREGRRRRLRPRQGEEARDR